MPWGSGDLTSVWEGTANIILAKEVFVRFGRNSILFGTRPHPHNVFLI